MLGTEYNWLISVSEPDEGAPRVRLASTGLLTVAVGVFCLLCVSLHAESGPRELLPEAPVATTGLNMEVTRDEAFADVRMRADLPPRALSALAGHGP